MKIKIWVIAILLMLTIFIPAEPSALACEPLDEISSGRLECRRSLAGLTSSNVQLTPVALNVASAPRGTSPNDALTVPDAWQNLEPGASVWYKTTYSDSFRVLEFWLESNLPNAASFSLYSPDQTEGLSAASKPIGRGTHSKSDPENIIRWKASYAKPGAWYIYVSNNTNAPISYKLNHNQQTTDVKKCISYWEFLPTGEYVFWTDCGLHTGPHD